MHNDNIQVSCNTLLLVKPGQRFGLCVNFHLSAEKTIELREMWKMDEWEFEAQYADDLDALDDLGGRAKYKSYWNRSVE